MKEGDVYWADLPTPRGSEAGFRRPAVIVQAEWVTQSGIATVICVPLTTNLALADAPGNVALTAAATGLEKDSVAVVSAIRALEKNRFDEHAGRLTRAELRRIVHGIDMLLAD